jgi:hypothetical protein
MSSGKVIFLKDQRPSGMTTNNVVMQKAYDILGGITDFLKRYYGMFGISIIDYPLKKYVKTEEVEGEHLTVGRHLHVQGPRRVSVSIQIYSVEEEVYFFKFSEEITSLSVEDFVGLFGEMFHENYKKEVTPDPYH